MDTFARKCHIDSRRLHHGLFGTWAQKTVRSAVYPSRSTSPPDSDGRRASVRMESTWSVRMPLRDPTESRIVDLQLSGLSRSVGEIVVQCPGVSNGRPSLTPRARPLRNIFRRPLPVRAICTLTLRSRATRAQWSAAAARGLDGKSDRPCQWHDPDDHDQLSKPIHS